MRSKFNEAITDEKDQQDILLWLLAGSIVSIILLAFCTLHITRNIDISAVGTSLAGILGLGGFGYGAKRLGEKYGSDSSSDPK